MRYGYGYGYGRGARIHVALVQSLKAKDVQGDSVSLSWGSIEA